MALGCGCEWGEFEAEVDFEAESGVRVRVRVSALLWGGVRVEGKARVRLRLTESGVRVRVRGRARVCVWHRDSHVAMVYLARRPCTNQCSRKTQAVLRDASVSRGRATVKVIVCTPADLFSELRSTVRECNTHIAHST